MPTQNLMNYMASIPKKFGGSRTIAITTTLYRLLMSLDNQRLADFERQQAYQHDSAKAGADCASAANRRALHVEPLVADQRPVCTVLWDFKEFFDYIN